MFGKKRSFFERLTGSVPVRENGRDEVPTGWGDDAAEELEGELAVDIYQTPSEIVIKSMIAGVKPEDLTITITRDSVTLKGKRETTREINDGDYIQRELYWGAFARKITLPAEVEVEEAEAIEKNGLLTLRLPKLDKDKTQNLKVRSV